MLNFAMHPKEVADLLKDAKELNLDRRKLRTTRTKTGTARVVRTLPGSFALLAFLVDFGTLLPYFRFTRGVAGDGTTESQETETLQ